MAVDNRVARSLGSRVCARGCVWVAPLTGCQQFVNGNVTHTRTRAPTRVDAGSAESRAEQDERRRAPTGANDDS